MNKAAFANAEILENLLCHYVDESFVKDLDLTYMESLPTEFVAESMSKRFAAKAMLHTCFYYLNFKVKKIFGFLFEFLLIQP